MDAAWYDSRRLTSILAVLYLCDGMSHVPWAVCQSRSKCGFCQLVGSTITTFEIMLMTFKGRDFITLEKERILWMSSFNAEKSGHILAVQPLSINMLLLHIDNVDHSFHTIDVQCWHNNAFENRPSAWEWGGRGSSNNISSHEMWSLLIPPDRHVVQWWRISGPSHRSDENLWWFRTVSFSRTTLQ